jgi:hypothetical protein
MYAKRLYNIDRIIDVNINAQKTPILIKCDEKQRLSLKVMYEKYEGNQPVIYGDTALNTDGFQVLNTSAPYLASDLYVLKTQYYNEALTYLGISNINTIKKERLITDEVQRNQGSTIANRYSRLEARRQACKQINDMFGLNIWVDYRHDYMVIDEELDSTEASAQDNIELSTHDQKDTDTN